MTIDGLCLFIGITDQTLYNYKERGEDFLDVITLAEKVIKHQKFTGAAADLLNPNIIARDLGLRDKSDVDHGLQVANPIMELIKQVSGRTIEPNGKQ